MPQNRTTIRFAVAIAASVIAAPALAQQEPCIGNSGPLTGPAAFGGVAMKYGAEIAIDEINEVAACSARSSRLIQYDDAGAPPRGVDNIRRIALSDKCIAILGGYHSTVGLAQVDPVNEIGIPYIGTIAANTKIIENGKSPNFMFRVSAKDKWVAHFLVEQALEGSARTERLPFIYENTGWGNGAVAGLQGCDERQEQRGFCGRDVQLERSGYVGPGDPDTRFRRRYGRADLGPRSRRQSDPAQHRQDRLQTDHRIAAWGLSGNLGELAGPLANGVRVMQTFSWLGDMDPKTKVIWEKIQKKYGLKDPSELRRWDPATANSYDAVYILAKAIENGRLLRLAAKCARRSTAWSIPAWLRTYKPAFDASPIRSARMRSCRNSTG